MRINNRALLWLIALRANARYAYERYIHYIYAPMCAIYIICAKLVIYSTTAKFSA